MLDVETLGVALKLVKEGGGGGGEGAAIIDDSKILTSTTWSSQKIVDTLCPPFTVSGAIVQCTPVANYPLGVQVEITPTQEGTGDPSPENVRPIVGWEQVNIWRDGKNLLNEQSYIKGIWNTDFSIGTTTDDRYVSWKTFLSKGNYLLSSNVPLTIVRAFSSFDNSAQITVGSLSITNVTSYDINMSTGGYLYLSTRRHDEAPFDIANVQIHLSVTSTSYEPYRGQTYTIQLGQTVYGGALDVNTGTLTVTHKHFSLPISEMNNSENYPGWIDVEDLEECAIPDFDGLVQNTIANCLNKIRINTKYQDKKIYGTSTAWGMTQSELKAAYPDLVCEIIIPLLAPPTIQLTLQQILALSGTNTLYANVGDITVTGVSDPGAAIATLQDRLTALENNALN